MLAIRLPETIEKRLERLAKRTGRTKTFYAREAILQHLEDLEDIYLAEKELANIRNGKAKTIPLDEVTRPHKVSSERLSAARNLKPVPEWIDDPEQVRLHANVAKLIGIIDNPDLPRSDNVREAVRDRLMERYKQRPKSD